jgi:hypothetical protein
MEPVTPETLTKFLTRLRERYPNQATLYLLGGSALLLLGNPRQTLDIDYTTDLQPQEQQALETVMNQLLLSTGSILKRFPLQSSFLSRLERPGPLSDHSIANRSAPVDFPDFRRKC